MPSLHPRIHPSREKAKRAISRIIREKVDAIPLNLIDTCLGVIVDRVTMISNFEKLEEYKRIEESFSDNGAKRFRDLLNSYFEYATFSHRWNETETTKEPTYGFIKGAQDKGQNIYDLKGGKDHEKNMLKLRSFCYTAAKCGFRWAWSDTCCINKASPSEVQVSINSMFKWYSNSALTIVYLHDVPDVDSTMPRLSHTPHLVHDFVAKHSTGSQNPPILQYAEGKEFFDTQVEESALEDLLKQCFKEADGELNVIPQWCVRCWTLQEMVAAQRLRFYCETWKALEPAFDPPDDNHIERFSDHRKVPLWKYALSRSTGVDVQSLTDFTPGTTNVREKFHWASRREATQIEDMAYSLLGIFDINMPVLYGEGMKAFVRLQEEIMKRSHDLSIFDFCGYASNVNTCLAHSPSCYIEKPLELERKTKGAQMGIDAESKEVCDEESDDESTKGDNEEHGSTPCSNGENPVVTKHILAWGSRAVDFFKKFIQADPPLGHSLINGAITVSVFEHKVTIDVIDHVTLHYKATAKGLTPTKFTTLEALKLEKGGPVYYLVRVYDRHVRRAIEIFVSANSGKDKNAEGRGKGPKPLVGVGKGLVDDANDLGSQEKPSAHAKLQDHRKERKDREAKFLTNPFVVLLVAQDGDTWCRIATESRIIVSYRNLKLNQAVERRTLV